MRHLGAAGVRVPEGFATSADAYREHLRLSGLVQAGLDSISVAPDSFVAVKQNVAAAEQELDG